MSKVLVELTANQARIEVAFAYDSNRVWKIKSIPGRTFLRKTSTWAVPKDMDTCRLLREAFQDDLEIGPELRLWAEHQTELERNLGSLAQAETAELTVLPERLPSLYEAIHVGPKGRFMTKKEFKAALKEDPSFQAADVAFMAQADAPGNFNHPGTGKTIETIAATYEAKLDHGLHIVACPKTSMETVWETELLTWSDAWVLCARGRRSQREAAVEEALQLAAEGENVWLIINPQMLGLVKDNTNTSTVHTVKVKPKEYDAGMGCMCDAMKDPHWHYDFRYPELSNLEITQLIIDEAHKAAIGNTTAVTAVGMRKVGEMAKKRIVLTATPMGGKPIKLFGILQFLRPDVYTSKWTWADKWLDVETTAYGKNLKMAKLKRSTQAAFYRSLVPYALRRTKEECLPWLPAKQWVHVWCEMEDEQASYYNKFAADAEIRIDEQSLTATNILAEYTRLRQLATSVCEIEDGSLIPTSNSCKLPHLDQILEELGIIAEDEDDKTDEQCVIFSQFNGCVDMVAEHLAAKGVAVATLTGKTTERERTRLQREFQKEGGLQVLIMNVQAGGVSITLDRASTVVFMDESWNPDDQEQAEDRCHRASRIHQVTIYYLRTKDTVEEYVLDTTTGKSLTNSQILDIRRRVDEQFEAHTVQLEHQD